MDKHILVIEDEAAIREIITVPLEAQGYKVTAAADGLEGITAFRSAQFDLVLLDIMMPKIDGYTVCEMIRKVSDVPVILLTALDSEEAQIRGFDTLADDYITKPFSVKLLLKRIEAQLRRSAPHSDDDCIRYADLVVSEAERSVTVAGNQVTLTHLEFEILLLLLKNKGRVFSRDDLLNLVWGYDFTGYEKGVNFHIMNLRKKLKGDYIETVRGVGYRIAKENKKQP
ncbi:MAG: response regulator transcription factor [Ruminococcus sp.]|nr:response regulator transcription factor [Ruminococcus sp.]